VELGFAALAALAQTWDTMEPEEDEEDHVKKLKRWKAGCAQLVNTFSALLQRAWLSSTQVNELPRPEIGWNGPAFHHISHTILGATLGNYPIFILFAYVHSRFLRQFTMNFC
jgi:hypothetical protein